MLIENKLKFKTTKRNKNIVKIEKVDEKMIIDQIDKLENFI